MTTSLQTPDSSLFVENLSRRKISKMPSARSARWEKKNCLDQLMMVVLSQVESVQIHKDRKGESKGIAYVKFSKTSEAALAVEEMNGRCLGHHPRPLKVKEEFL